MELALREWAHLPIDQSEYVLATKRKTWRDDSGELTVGKEICLNSIDQVIVVFFDGISAWEKFEERDAVILYTQILPSSIVCSDYYAIFVLMHVLSFLQQDCTRKMEWQLEYE